MTQAKSLAKVFESIVRAMGGTRSVKVQTLRGQNGFSDTGVVFFLGPGYLDAAWRRQRFDPTSVTLTGITHAVSAWHAVESVQTVLAEPVEALGRNHLHVASSAVGCVR